MALKIRNTFLVKYYNFTVDNSRVIALYSRLDDLISSGYLRVIEFPLLDSISRIGFVLLKNRIERTPSHLISKTQFSLLNGLSTGIDNIGLIFVGNPDTGRSLNSRSDLFFLLLLPLTGGE